MNQVERVLREKRFERPLENWDKVVQMLRFTKYSAMPYSDKWYKEREVVREEIRTAYRVIRNLFNEVWEEPEKIRILKSRPVSLVPIGNVDEIIRNKCIRYKEFNWLRPEIIGPDVMLSYIALREFGFRVRFDISDDSFMEMADVILTLNLLRPSKLFPVLNDSNRSRVEKLVTLNDMLVECDLPKLVGTPKDNILAGMIEARRKYEETIKRYRERLESIESRERKKRRRTTQ